MKDFGDGEGLGPSCYGFEVRVDIGCGAKRSMACICGWWCWGEECGNDAEDDAEPEGRGESVVEEEVGCFYCHGDYLGSGDVSILK